MRKIKFWSLIVGGTAFAGSAIYIGAPSSGTYWIIVLCFSAAAPAGAGILLADYLQSTPIFFRTSERIVVRRNRSYPLLMLAACCLNSAGLILGFFHIEPAHSFRRGVTGAEMKFLILLVLPFAAYFVFFYLREYLAKSTDIILDRYGITDQRTRYKSIAWTEIAQAEMHGETPKNFIVLTLRHPEWHPRSWHHRLKDALTRKISPAQLTIHTAGIVGTPDSLLQEIRRRVAKAELERCKDF